MSVLKTIDNDTKTRNKFLLDKQNIEEYNHHYKWYSMGRITEVATQDRNVDFHSRRASTKRDLKGTLPPSRDFLPLKIKGIIPSDDADDGRDDILATIDKTRPRSIERCVAIAEAELFGQISPVEGRKLLRGYPIAKNSLKAYFSIK